MADQPPCLCIVSGERLRGGEFVAALRSSLRVHDELEIIVDRRSGEPVGEWERAEDRRRRPQVDQALRANGFAVIPAPPASDARGGLPLLVPTRRPDDDDEVRLEAIRDFKRERSSGLVPWLVAALVIIAVVAFALSPTGHALRIGLERRISPEGRGTVDPTAQAPSATPAPPGVPRTEPEPSRDATVTPRREDRAAQAASTAPPRTAREIPEQTRPRANEPPRPSAPSSMPREPVTAPAVPEPASRVFAPRFAGLPRVELVRESGAAIGTYAVRITDPAGQPLTDADVLLIAHMSDGTMENVRMGFLPSQGTYRGALPPARSAPVDLRIRVMTGDKRIEIPVGP